jgi:outer membrane lipoprotein SlyB
MKKLLAILLLSMLSLGAPMAALASCNDCGRVTYIEAYTGHRNTTGGAVAGAVVGGLIGNQVGGGSGKTLATVAGAAGGAYAGKKIAENSERTKYRVTVRMDEGYDKTVTQNSVRGIQVGSRVRVRHGTASRL